MFSPLKSLNSDSYIIAEVGQNHQGCLDEAMRYVSVFAGLGANAIKFQIRNNRTLFDSSVYSSPYDTENSFGETYGQHREALELDYSAYQQLRDRCKLYRVDFVVTPFDEPSLDQCISLDVDLIKIASFDSGNLPFIYRIAQTRKPILLSTGGSTLEQIILSANTIKQVHEDFAILHCVSKYPCPIQDVQLWRIRKLAKTFPSQTLGISDHFNGILTGPLAYMFGARVFEKHVTFDRSQRGTDHAFSLEPDGFRKFVRDISRTPLMTEKSEYKELGNEKVFQKLGKSLVATRDIPANETITIESLSGRICRPVVIPVRQSSEVIGKRASVTINAGAYINWDMITR